ncbi:hypothetical protein MtrunA17_Chr1g0183551 [Medicago truncatula]|uniref:Transmembrane protein, putative n=1 Tax=Medicago truncatula TaxID=3880 RepID=A0A072VL05_MEDTR|nr:transmembrane protein, putative [Medicago truncatula]RHN80005.1 hypothetical protein MtrunA17_Chr1g0183551 [Medicago truncatula]
MGSTTQALIILAFSYICLSSIFLWNYKPPIHPTEQKALYNVLNSINPDFPWTTRFSGDLCRLPPPGVVCRYSYFHLLKYRKLRSHVVEMNFGNYDSDEKQNPTLPCSHNATFNSTLFTPFNYLGKLIFRECFNNRENPIIISLSTFPTTLQQLVFIDNLSPIQGSFSFAEFGMINKLQIVRTHKSLVGKEKE